MPKIDPRIEQIVPRIGATLCFSCCKKWLTFQEPFQFLSGPILFYMSNRKMAIFGNNEYQLQWKNLSQKHDYFVPPLRRDWINVGINVVTLEIT